MRAIVHFAVGISGMLLVLTYLDLGYRREFLLMFASGFWALIPDLGFVLLRIIGPGVASVWKRVFNSVFGNLFWFHTVLDDLESADDVLELVGALVLLAAAISVYYVSNDWEGT